MELTCLLMILLYFRLRIRVKAMQAVVESQSNRLASLTAEKEVATLGQQDESTGQGVVFCLCTPIPLTYFLFSFSIL